MNFSTTAAAAATSSVLAGKKQHEKTTYIVPHVFSRDYSYIIAQGYGTSNDESDKQKYHTQHTQQVNATLTS